MKKYIALFLVAIMVLAMPVMAAQSPTAKSVVKANMPTVLSTADEVLSLGNVEAYDALAVCFYNIMLDGDVTVNGVTIDAERFVKILTYISAEEIAEFLQNAVITA